MREEALNIKFVQDVEKFPVLYNYNLPGYSRKDETDKAWNAVGDMNKLTVVECKEKWRNLRTTFARRMKLPASGSGKPKKPYYLADIMEFTIPFIRTVLPCASGNVPAMPNNVVEADDTSTLKIEGEFDEVVDDISPSPSESVSVSEPCDRHENDGGQSTKKLRKMCSRKKVQLEVDNAMSCYFKAKTAKLQTTEAEEVTNTKESIKMFFFSLIPDLLEFNKSQLRQFKQEVLQSIETISTHGSKSTIDESEYITVESYLGQAGHLISTTSPSTSLGVQSPPNETVLIYNE